MTIEEAIICLKGIKNYGRDTFAEQTNWQDCLDIAIKSLEQELKENDRVKTELNRVKTELELCKVSEYDKDHIWYKGKQYISLRRFLEVKSEKPSVNPQEPKTDVLDKIREIVNEWQLDSWTDNLSYECMIKIAELIEPQERRNEMLRDEVAKYTELTGEDGSHTPIMKIGAYLDGYEKGLSVLGKIKAEINEYSSLWVEYNIIGHTDRAIEITVENVLKQAKEQVLEIIDRYRQEE